MPRHRRYVVAGVPVHIIQRGNNRNACFFDEKDNLLYLRHLHELASQFTCSVHAYCLMTNHVHLLITNNGDTNNDTNNGDSALNSVSRRVLSPASRLGCASAIKYAVCH